MRYLWLPAYVCPDVPAAAPPGCEVRWYGHGPGLPLRGLDPASGDAVLVVDYFGQGRLNDVVRDLNTCADVLWIEDRAQAMAADGPLAGAVRLYSPRKLVGVADGGLLVSDEALPPSPPAGASDPDAWTGPLARFADPAGAAPASWSAPFQAREAAVSAQPKPLDPLTAALLQRIAAEPLIARRKANFARLAERLPDHALMPDRAPDFAPLAFPMRVRDAAGVVARMAERGVFCPRHWASLPSPAADFPEAHALAAVLVSAPCDHRYDPADMDRVADAVLACAEPL